MKLTAKHFFNFGFIFEVFVFAISLLFSVGVAINYIITADNVMLASGGSLDVWSFLILFFIATGILILILKYWKKPLVVKVLFYLAITEGVWIFLDAYLLWPFNLYVLLFVLGFWFILKNVLWHNLVVTLATSGIAAYFGMNFKPGSVILMLLFLSVYDYWAVYKTKHMVQMFKGLSKSKVHFSLIIPYFISDLRTPVKEVKQNDRFMFLGTGDVALPAIFVVSCLKISLKASYYSAVGAILGLILLYVLFNIQKKHAPMPGLPPIVFGSVVGFLIYLIIN